MRFTFVFFNEFFRAIFQRTLSKLASQLRERQKQKKFVYSDLFKKLHLFFKYLTYITAKAIYKKFNSYVFYSI